MSAERSLGDALRCAVVEPLQQAASLAAQPDGEAAVHELRKMTKRLRAFLALVGPTLDEAECRRLRGGLRDAAALLAATRDADVLRRTLRSLTGDPAPADLLPSPPVVDRDAALLAAADLLVEVGRDATKLEWGLLDRAALDAGFARSRDRERHAMDDVLAAPESETVHTWRKRTKALWYQLRLARDLGWPALDEHIAELDQLQETLGDHHDLSVLAAALLEGGWKPPLAALFPKIGERQGALLARGLGLKRTSC